MDYIYILPFHDFVLFKSLVDFKKFSLMMMIRITTTLKNSHINHNIRENNSSVSKPVLLFTFIAQDIFLK